MTEKLILILNRRTWLWDNKKALTNTLAFVILLERKNLMEIYENDTDKIILVKMIIAIATLIITGYSIVSNCTDVLRNRKKRMGFGKAN